MKPPLERIFLIDLSTGIAGPYAAMLLTDMGADCIKVEPKEGDPARGMPGFLVWNRGKKGLTLKLDTGEGREILYRMAKKADVVIESFNPRQAKHLGLDYESLSRLNSRLIYCAMPLFGESGPLSEKPGNEGVVAALAGIMAGQGGLGRPPVFVTLPLASYGAAFLAAYGIAAALYTREVTGRGQKVEVSVLSGALAMQTAMFVSAETITPVTSSQSAQQGINPVYRLYECQDDWLFVACGNPTFWNKLCIVLDRADLTADPRFQNAPWGIVEEEHRNALYSIMAETLRQKPRDYWLKLFEAADVPCAPVSRREEFMEDPQVKHNQMIVTVNDPKLGEVKQMGIPLTIVERPGRIKGSAPQLGEHNNLILEEFGYSDNEIAQLGDKGVV